MAQKSERGPGGAPATASINNSAAEHTAPPQDNQPRPDLVAELDALFCSLWPGRLHELFDPDHPKPLAIGLGKEIADQLGLTAAERRQLGKLLGKWTGRISYLKALRLDDAWRYGMDGQPVEPVSREHAIGARQLIYQRRQRLDRQKAELERQTAKEAQGCRANAALPKLQLRASP
jgi:ProQ/FINO family